MSGPGGLPIAVTTLGSLHQRESAADALRSIARAGYSRVDVSPTPPHLSMAATGAYERAALRRLLAELGLECVSVSPTEINLVSTNPAYAELSLNELERSLELAHDLGAGFVVFAPGRLFVLNPAPVEDALDMLAAQLGRLLAVAERLGVVLAVETVPFGWMQTGRDVAGFVDRLDSPWLRGAYDVANTVAIEPFADGLDALGERLAVLHMSGAWRDRWAHASVRDGDVDFAALAAALRERGYSGPTVYELVDGRDPEARLREDRAALAAWGWDT